MFRFLLTLRASHWPRVAPTLFGACGRTSNTGLAHFSGSSCCPTFAHGAVAQFGSRTITREGDSVTSGRSRCSRVLRRNS